MLSMSLILIASFTTSVYANHERGHRERPRMSEEHRAAFKECAQSTGVKKPDFKAGERPSKEDRRKMRECLKAKGIEMPKHKKMKKPAE